MVFIWMFLVGEDGALQLCFLEPGAGQVLVQDLLGAGEALAAAGRHAQVAAQFFHAGDAQLHGLTDFTIRYVVADTYNHCYTFWLGYVIEQTHK
jgi:hypothetical protein